MKTCKKCGKEHDGSFGSGLFCSKSCANSRVFSKETREKRSKSNKESNLKIAAVKGVFICEDCNKSFDNAQSRNSHYSHCFPRDERLGRIHRRDPFNEQGRRNWRKGKTTENDDRIKNYYIKLTEKYKEQLLNNSFELKARGSYKRWLFRTGLKKECCERCKIKEWNNMTIIFDLHHKDGNNYNNNLENLEILCPNCHSQTNTFTGKNTKIFKNKINLES